MNKKLYIIIPIIAVLVAFSITFVLGYQAKREQVVEELKKKQAEKNEPTAEDYAFRDKTEPSFIYANDGADIVKSMSEKQLQSLIFDVRQKIKEYDDKHEELTEEERRIRLARETLQADIEKLSELRTQLTTTLASLKQQEQNLKNTLIEIDEIEKANLKRIAERYDKMDVEYASKIIVNMVGNRQIDDAAKIVNYMSERTSGKLLGEIAREKTDIASLLSDKIKKIKETE